MVPAPRKYPNELRERAMRLVVEAREQDPELSLNAAVHADRAAGRGQSGHAARLVQAGGHRRGAQAGTTTSDAARIKELEQRTGSSNAPTRFCWRPPRSSRGSSTRDCRGSRLHR